VSAPRALALLAVASLALATSAVSKKAKARTCEDGRFLIDSGGPLIGPGQEAIVVEGAQVRIDAGCALTVAKLKVTRAGTRLRGSWRTCTSLQNVRLAAKFDADCARLTGTFRAKKVRRTFTAVRSRCGDGRLDPGNREQCEPPGSAACDRDCQAVAPPTTTLGTIPGITSTTTTVTTTTVTTTTMPGPLPVWRPATVPWDPECAAGCVDVGQTIPLPHSGAKLRLRMNPATDDPIAQWGDCLESVLGCFERDGALAPCVEAASCPAECKALFRERAAAAADEDARVTAFEAVLVERTAPCRPPQAVTP
jgi:hypothetical protein